MMHAVLADTGPLYAIVDPRDEFHDQAVEQMRRLIRDRSRVVVAYPTLLEAYSMVRHRLGGRAASDWLNDMADATLINPTPDDYSHAMVRIRKFADQPITLFDATVAILAGRLRLQVWTYDHHFELMRVGVWR